MKPPNSAPLCGEPRAVSHATARPWADPARSLGVGVLCAAGTPDGISLEKPSSPVRSACMKAGYGITPACQACYN